MSELKAHIAPTPDGTGLADYYLKSEADKVIAELEDELRAANEQVENLINSASSIMLFQDRVNDNKCAELRHNKFKRCLAMARWCMTEYLHSKCLDFTNTEQWYWHRWHIRWRNLADKFKEGK